MKTRKLSLSILLLANLFCMFVVAHVHADRFDYHTIKGKHATLALSANEGIFEGETDFERKGKARPQPMTHFGKQWRGNSHLLWNGVVGESLDTSFSTSKAGKFQLEMQLTCAPDYGIFSIHLNGKLVQKSIDLYSSKVELAAMLNLGTVTLEPGKQTLGFKLIGGNAKARKFRGKGYLMGLDYLHLKDMTPRKIPVKTETPKEDEKSSPALKITFEQVKPILSEHCYRCHGEKKPKGKLNLKALMSREAFIENIEVVRKVAKALRLREMPPEDEKQLSKPDHAQLLHLFDSLVQEYLETSGHLSPIVMRRLNRYEYNNAVRDLLQLKGDIYPLPEKTIRAARPYFTPASGRMPKSISVSNRSLGKNQIEKPILTGVVPFAIDLQAEHGFNNRGDELSMSPIQMESFLKLSQSIVHAPQFDNYCRITDSLFKSPGNLSRDDQLKLARKRLAPLMERAFRSHVDQATLDRYIKFFARDVAETRSFSKSMKRVVSGILASPRFLYLIENKQNIQSVDPVDAYELATRLSFFLWNSIPDEALLNDARTGDLLKPDRLDKQVRRMLLDPKSQSLSQDFARQWLRLDQLIAAIPDFDRFEIYYSRIGCEQWKFGLQTMLEPLLLFESIMIEDRSIMLLIDSNYSYRSDELHSWYVANKPFGYRRNRGRFNTNQQAFTRRTLDTRKQGGVITAASVLTMTSSPLRTSPINRGAWVASVIFNQPPPPPPDNIPEIEKDDAEIEAKGLTLRQRLKQHQADQACASCHAKIDPLGFALENYDAIGRWRDKYKSGLAIDTSGELFGKVKFKDIVGLKDALLDNPQWFMRAFSEHMLSYALGRKLELADKPAVDLITKQAMASRGQFSSVIRAVATSYPFLHKPNQTADRVKKLPGAQGATAPLKLSYPQSKQARSNDDH